MLNVKMNHLRCWALLNESRDELSSIQNVGTCLTCLACGLALDLDHVSWKLTCKRHVTRLCSPHSPLEMERFAAGYDWLNSNFAHRFLNNKCLPIMNNVLLVFLQRSLFLHCTRDILSACIQKRFSIYGCNCITWWSYFGLNVNSILTSQMKRTLRSSRFMGQIYICFLNTPHTNSSYRCFRSLNTLISLNMSSTIYLYTLDIQID